MRPRLAVLVLALVVLPTAVLSLLASRVLRTSELTLRRDLSLVAGEEIRHIEDAARGRLLTRLKDLKSAMGAQALRGGSPEIEAAVARLDGRGESLGRVYVFVSPWGLLYPESADEVLTAALRREIAAAGPHQETLLFSADGRSFCFAALGTRPPMYAGFEPGPDELASTLGAALEAARGGRFVMSARGRDGLPLTSVPGREGPVVVRDTLGGVSVAGPAASERDAAIEGPASILELRSPFQGYTVEARVRDADRLRRAGRLRSQLFAWGIAVLAAGICGGVAVVLREAASEIRKAKSRSEFVIGVSHDLRTPVASMKMLAETLYLGRVADARRQREFLGMIVRECERLSHLVERVLFFVRFGQHALRYSLGETDPGQLARSAAAVFLGRYEGMPEPQVPRISVEVVGSPPAVQADGSAMTQVLLNLLDNAEKYSRGRGAGVGGRGAGVGGRGSEAGGEKSEVGGQRSERPARIDVAVGTEHRRGWLPWTRRKWASISVRDYGMGMSRQVLRRLFRQFYRAPEAQEGNITGLGLGLALCRHVVRAHGGRIVVSSTPGQGSTFTVLLPEGKTA